MTRGKYSKYVVPAPITKLGIPGYAWNSVYAHKDQLQADCTLTFHYITENFEEGPPHKHNAHQIMCFTGSDLKNIADFDAEIEIALGDEGEVQKITSPSIVTIPPGLMHCPLRFTRLGKPVVFIEILLGKSYERYTASGELIEHRPGEVVTKLI